MQFVFAFMVLTMSFHSYGKRAAPTSVPDVFGNELRYTVVHWGYANGTNQNGGYVEARSIKSDKKVWGLLVYKNSYLKDLESDVQDIFITSIRLDNEGNTLIVTNEARSVFHVDLKTLSVQHVE